MIRTVKTFAVGFLLTWSYGQATAKINLNVDAELGRRWTQERTKMDGATAKQNYYSNEYAFGAHYQVMELPVAVGANLSLLDFNNKDFEDANTKVDTGYGVELGFGGKAWLPEEITQTKAVVPFVKLGYVALSRNYLKMKSQGVSSKYEYSTPGFQVKVGADMSVNDDFAVTAEYAYTDQYQDGKAKIDGKKVNVGNSSTKSQALLLGAQLKV